MYCSYLVFQLFSHKRLYDDKNVHKPETIEYTPRIGPGAKDWSQKSSGSFTTEETGRRGTTESDNGEEDEEVPELSLPMTIGLLVVVAALVGITAEGLVHSIDGLASRSPISKEFIGFILLPIIGNAPECFAAVTVSVKDKLTSSLVATVGSSIVGSLPPQLRLMCVILNLLLPANFVVCYPVHYYPRVDHWSSDYDALRLARVYRALLLSVDPQLRRARWKVELVERNDLDMLVRLTLPLIVSSFLFSLLSEANVCSCRNIGTLLWR